MKLNKMMFAAMAFAAVAMIGCNKKNNDPVTPTPTPTPGGDDPQEEVEIPEVDAPGAGKVTFVIQIPEGTECNGIALKGTLDGAAWSGANTYVGADKADASKDECIKFEPIDGSKIWFKATYNLGATAWDTDVNLKGKICLIYTDDSSWEGQAVNPEIINDYTTVDCSYDGDMLIHGATGGLCYIKIGGWQTSECVTPEDYKITVIVPAFCGEEFAIELIGSFCGWDDSKTVALTKVEGTKYTATIKATPNAEWKVRHVGSWAEGEVQIKSAEDDTWGGVPNNVLGESKDVTMDYSDAEKYRWNVCED